MVKKLFIGLMTLALGLMAFPGAGLGAAPRYLFKDISRPYDNDPGRAIDINDFGQVITNHNVLYTPDGQWTLISLTGQGTSGAPISINNAGQVAGYGYDHAYLWTAEQGFTFLPGIDGKESIIAYGINNLGQIVGYLGSPLTPVRWDGPHSVTDLTVFPGWDPLSVSAGNVMAINDAGWIVARASVPDRSWCGMLFNGASWTFLGSLTPGAGDSHPLSLNNKGEVVGASPTIPGGGKSHAFHWANGVMRDLGTLPGLDYSEAYHINEAGQIVGTSYNTDGYNNYWDWTAVIWTSEGIQDLNHLVVNLPPNVVLRRAYAINNQGCIVGDYYGQREAPFLLIPISPVVAGGINVLLLD